MKKEVYEHIASTFFDNKKDKNNYKKKYIRLYIIFGCIFSLIAFCILGGFTSKRNIFLKSLYVFQDKSPVIIDFDFTSLGTSKIITLTFDLKNTDLSEYHFIELAAKTEAKTKIDNTIKVQIDNHLLEIDSKFISGINNKWKKFTLSLSDFELISDWTKIRNIRFTVEDWNVSNKKDRIFIDEVCFVE